MGKLKIWATEVLNSLIQGGWDSSQGQQHHQKQKMEKSILRAKKMWILKKWCWM